jgi:hypothetical protein
MMMNKHLARMWMATAAVICVVAFAGPALAEDPSQAGEKVGVEGTYVRVAENEEGWVVLGYKIANESVGNEYMLIDLGMTVQKGQKGQKITRDQVKLVTPDKTVLDMLTQPQYEDVAGKLAAMEEKANMMGDSINYFPAMANQACRIGYFTDTSQPMRGPAFDFVDLNPQRACVGRVYFHVPGGIKLGNYNLDVKFANSVVKVPIEIMTKEQAKEFEKKWKEAQKEAKHDGHEH